MYPGRRRLQKTISPFHNQQWKGKTQDARNQYVRKAAAYQKKQRKQIVLAVDAVRTELAISRMREEMEENEDTGLVRRKCRWDDACLNRLNDTFENGHFDSNLVARNVLRASEAPTTASDAKMAACRT